MPEYIDQTNRTVFITYPPKRIVSLVPSQTELLYDLGLDEQVVGITKFCVHPENWFRNKTRVGGTKQLKMEFVHSLNPDLIIANLEENVKEQVEELMGHYPVWVSDVSNLPGAYEMIAQIGRITDRNDKAEEINQRIKESFSSLPAPDSRLSTHISRLPACYLIWKNPYMTIGGDTFIHSMLEAAGFENVFKNKNRYPGVTIEELKTLNVKLVLLSSEPFPFAQKHIQELQDELPGTQIMLVDGELFSWYGSRMLKAPAYFKELQREIGNAQ